jgi:hypothetical protein
MFDHDHQLVLDANDLEQIHYKKKHAIVLNTENEEMVSLLSIE